MLIYEQRKKSIDEDNKQRRNPSYQSPVNALPTGMKPQNKQLSGLAGTPIQPQEDIPEHQKGAFFKQKAAHQKNSKAFDTGTNMLESVAAQLGQAVKRGEMPQSLAEKKFKQAVDDFAKDSRGIQMAKQRKEVMESDRNQNNKTVLMKHGKDLSNEIIDAREGDKDAQNRLRDMKFDWTKPKADAVVEMADKKEEPQPTATDMAVDADQQQEESNMPTEQGAM